MVRSPFKCEHEGCLSELATEQCGICEAWICDEHALYTVRTEGYRCPTCRDPLDRHVWMMREGARVYTDQRMIGLRSDADLDRLAPRPIKRIIILVAAVVAAAVVAAAILLG